jgi:hypothetical protein
MALTEIVIEPNPAIEGGTVTITLPHGGPWYVSLDPSGQVTRIEPDDNNQVEIAAPGKGGQTFTVADLSDPMTSASFDIVSSFSVS